MENLLTRRAAGAVVALLILTACGANGGGMPSAASAVQGAATHVDGSAKPVNLSGEYAGTIKDSLHGTGKASARLSQAKSALGGSLTIAGNSTVEYISWTQSGNVVDGTSVFAASSGYCTFSHAGTYNSKTSTLTGSYKAVYGCSGETGKYTLKHRCYYKGTGGADIRPENGPRPC
jgi:hypothetical protein